MPLFRAFAIYKMAPVFPKGPIMMTMIDLQITNSLDKIKQN